ncbi:hypothetical protein vseg_000623 [Gypsophila vaccaria]
MQYQEDSLKKEFLKKWIKGLQSFSPSKFNNMTLFQRKQVIKLSSSLAMASTRDNSRTLWTKSVITKAYGDDEAKDLAKKILGRYNKNYKYSLSKYKNNNNNIYNKKVISKKISKIRKTFPRKIGRFNSNKVKARLIAKKLVEKRVKILKGLIPGGECMDECRLIKETLDYVVSLRAQVDVMHYIANSSYN